MARSLWCRHANCGKPYESVAGQLPKICPACEQTAAWSTVPASSVVYPDPTKPYELSDRDGRFLKLLRIAPD